ncbi:hypothetical protein QUF90_12190 [Desulfococcaceae bacterium HSG9]|nr:hypothetical protein [Desulfococcaceae bacterium HSG9]
MSEDQFNSVSDRIYQLEQSDLRRNIKNRAQFIIQFFLLLVVILGIGYYFYQRLDSDIQKVATAQALHFSKHTDSKLSAKKMAAQIVDQIENNEQVRTTIKKVVADDLQRTTLKTPLTEEVAEKPAIENSDALKTDPKQVADDSPPKTDSEQVADDSPPKTDSEQVADDSPQKTDSEQVVDDSSKKEETVPKVAKDFKAASKFEAQGFTYLLSGEFDKAITAFNKAEISFPSYHQVYEISRLLRKEKADLDNPEKRRQIYLQIVNEMSYGAPSEMLEQLKKLASEDGIAIKTDG